MMLRPLAATIGALLSLASTFALAEGIHTVYQRTDLVANRANAAGTPVVAVAPAATLVIDPNLVNAWGIAFGGGPVWTSNNDTASSTLYDGFGAFKGKFGTPANPTGIIANATAAFLTYKETPTSTGTVSAGFVWSHEGGEISAWSSAQVNRGAAVTVVPADATRNYKGLGFATNGALPFLYAADFKGGKIDVYFASTSAGSAAVAANTAVTPAVPAEPAVPATTAFAPVKLDGSVLKCAFVDPLLPQGYAPFNVQAVSGNLVVAYARQADANGNEAHGAGLGRVDLYSADGCLVRRLHDHGALNAPWGIALAPSSFGRHGGELLIGNFGSGTISAFNLSSGEFRGNLKDASGKAIVIDGLWGLAFGNGARFQPTDTLFYAAGPNGEADGLYGRLDAVTVAADD